MFGPNILANGHADFFSLYIERLDAASRLEITIFIENIIGRKKRLMRFPDRFAALEQRRGVAKRLAAPFVPINEPYQQRCFSHVSVQFLEHRKILGNEARFKNQILRRISSDSELRCQHQFRARGGETLVSRDDQFAVPAQIPYGWVDLSKTNLHVALRQLMRKNVRGKRNRRALCHSE